MSTRPATASWRDPGSPGDPGDPGDPGSPGGTGGSGRRPGARRGVVEIVAGAALGQGLLVLISPVLSRLYTPADFAVLQVFTGVVSVGAVAATLRLEVALPLAREGREQEAVLRLGLLATAVVAVAAGLLGALAAPVWVHGATLRGLWDLWWLVPLTIAALAAFQLVSARLIRAERYRELAGRNAAQGVGTALAQLGFGVAGLRPFGLLLGPGLGRVVALLVMTRPRRAAPDSREGFHDRREEGRGRAADMRAALHRFRRFPLLTTWSALLNNAAQYAPFLVWSLTFGAASTGWLAFTSRLLALPVTVIGQAVAQVYLGRGAAAARDSSGDLPRLTSLAVRRLAALGAVPAIALAVLAPPAFDLVFGSTWEQAGLYARILAVAFLAQFVAAPIAHVFNICERQDIALAWDAVRLVLVVAVPWLVWSLGGSDVDGVLGYAAVLVFSYAGVLVLARRVLRRAR